MAAINGSLKYVGVSGKVYNIDIYAPDAVATLLTFNPAGAAAATSPTFFRAPENGYIQDFAATAGPTATGLVFTADGGVIVGGSCRWANQLTSLPNRANLAIPIKAGALVGATQF